MEEVGNHLYAASIDSIDSNTNERLLLCLNTQKRDDDQAYRRHCMETIQTELDKLKERVNQPSKHTKVLSRDEVMKKAGSILKDTPAGKYFHVYTQTGTREDTSSKNKTHQTTSNKTLRESFQFYYEIKEFLVEEDSRLDGTFLIQTNQRNYTKKRLIEIYKHLHTVENAFKILKNDLDVRPLYHWKEQRVKGHIYMCIIAYFFMMAIEYTSKQKNLGLSGRKILRLLSTIHLLTLILPKGEKRFAVTGVGKEEKGVLQSFNISTLKLPMVV
jgi:transposase